VRPVLWCVRRAHTRASVCHLCDVTHTHTPSQA
jgi:hypothetical protein